MGETCESIRVCVQAARDIQQKLFLNNDLSDIICTADSGIGEIRQLCKMQDEGDVLSLSECQGLMRTVTSCCE